MKAGMPFAALCSLALVGCERPPQGASDAATMPIADATVRPTDSIDPAMTALICEAGIAELFQQPAASMKSEAMAGGIIRVSYRRASDNTLWKNDCRLEGNRIVWRAVETSPGSVPARWRDDPADGVITFTMDGDRVVVKETF